MKMKLIVFFIYMSVLPIRLFGQEQTHVKKQTSVTQNHKPGYKDCPLFHVPPFDSLTSNRKLPDPFLFFDGTKRVSTKHEWNCRRKEIAALAQEFEYGYKPETRYAATRGQMGDSTLKIIVTEKGKQISFECRIIYPQKGTGPFPAMIGMGFSNLNNADLLKAGIAILSFPNNEIAQQRNTDSRGKGLYYDLFGVDDGASATMAWAWGISRLIDAIEKTPEANIDPACLGVTGCSRNGKGALVAGAFDDRIKLTIPQEPGAGGAASWRISDSVLASGKNVQTLHQIVQENVWFRKSFFRFAENVDRLPFDQHSIMSLVAPRALFVIENTSIEWLSPFSSWVSANAAHTVWQSLDIPDRMGFSQVGAHNHCALPASQSSEVMAFVKKFLLGESDVNTSILKTDGDYSPDAKVIIYWDAPYLR